MTNIFLSIYIRVIFLLKCSHVLFFDNVQVILRTKEFLLEVGEGCVGAVGVPSWWAPKIQNEGIKHCAHVHECIPFYHLTFYVNLPFLKSCINPC